MDVEYTDRYGGHAPKWLTACHGPCEALGWLPNDTRCPDCNGTGRATRLQAVARLPKWVARAAGVFRYALLSREGRRTYRAPWTSWPRYLVVVWRAAWS